ncbi:hypothetical protein R1sor_008883 [Riccia sorocarpa]|uniref:Reverse transcriptase zinc-binding domain-containing protein n=1 Tax=Riccia sorocarpa TaxID=122646 RepID=A0ABD3H701_9MARC
MEIEGADEEITCGGVESSNGITKKSMPTVSGGTRPPDSGMVCSMADKGTHGQEGETAADPEMRWEEGVTWAVLAEEIKSMPVNDNAAERDEAEIREIDLDIDKQRGHWAKQCPNKRPVGEGRPRGEDDRSVPPPPAPVDQVDRAEDVSSSSTTAPHEGFLPVVRGRARDGLGMARRERRSDGDKKRHQGKSGSKNKTTKELPLLPDLSIPSEVAVTARLGILPQGSFHTLCSTPVEPPTEKNPFWSNMTVLSQRNKIVSLGHMVPFTGDSPLQEFSRRSPKKKDYLVGMSVSSSSRLKAGPGLGPGAVAHKRWALGTMDHNGCRLSDSRESSLGSACSYRRERKHREDSLSQALVGDGQWHITGDFNQVEVEEDARSAATVIAGREERLETFRACLERNGMGRCPSFANLSRRWEIEHVQTDWLNRWRYLWQGLSNLLLKTWFWRILNLGLHTNSQAQKWGVSDGLCFMCNQAEETLDHLLWLCRRLSDRTEWVQSSLLGTQSPSTSLLQVIDRVLSTHKVCPAELVLLGETCWITWLERNAFLFEARMHLTPSKQILEESVRKSNTLINRSRRSDKVEIQRKVEQVFHEAETQLHLQAARTKAVQEIIREAARDDSQLSLPRLLESNHSQTQSTTSSASTSEGEASLTSMSTSTFT